MNFFVIFGALLSGIIGSMGLGSGTVLIILLTVFLSFEQTTAQGVNLVFFIPCAIYSIIFYLKKGLVKKKLVFPLVLPGLLGAAAGYILLNFITPQLLKRLFGAMLILIAAKQLFSQGLKLLQRKQGKEDK